VRRKKPNSVRLTTRSVRLASNRTQNEVLAKGE
jgi:hypothetical protein